MPFIESVWYFHQFWFARYLNADRGMKQGALTITWTVYAAAGVGSLAGGWLSGVLFKKDESPVNARIGIMLGAACLMPVSPFIAKAAGLPVMMTLTAVAVFASLAWLINISAIVVGVVPKHSVSTVFSVVSGPSSKPAGFLDQGFKALFGPLIEAVQGKGYGPSFFAMAFLHPLALIFLWAGGIRRPHHTPT